MGPLLDVCLGDTPDTGLSERSPGPRGRRSRWLAIITSQRLGSNGKNTNPDRQDLPIGSNQPRGLPRTRPLGGSLALPWMAQEGFEPSASLVLSESGLPVAYRAVI